MTSLLRGDRIVGWMLKGNVYWIRAKKLSAEDTRVLRKTKRMMSFLEQEIFSIPWKVLGSWVYILMDEDNGVLSDSIGLEEVPLGGSAYTWCHKSASKMSKLDSSKGSVTNFKEELRILERIDDKGIEKWRMWYGKEEKKEFQLDNLSDEDDGSGIRILWEAGAILERCEKRYGEETVEKLQEVGVIYYVC
ncbi:hypothetical protein Tco_0768738 [Tanacetum coccineum]